MNKIMLERAQELTRLAREEVAAATFDRKKIELAIRTAAGAGAGNVTINPPTPLKLKGTSAATAAEVWLATAGFRVRWDEHRSTPTGPAGDQLEIEW